MKKINLACLVEDDPVHVFLSEKYLKMTGMVENIMVCSNGKEAYDKLKAIMTEGKNMPELILLDLNMPVWDGWQFLDEFIQIPVPDDSKVSIFILSSSVNKSDMERAKEYNVVGNYMVKPIQLEALKEVLEEL